TQEEEQEVRLQLKQSPELQQLYDQLQELSGQLESLPELGPDSSVDQSFYQLLEQTQAEESPRRKPLTVASRSYHQIAAAVLFLLIGAGVGYYASTHQQQTEMSDLRLEMEETKSLVLSMLEQQSTSGRIKAVNYTYQLPQADWEIAKALLKALNTDKSVNVRLAALDALVLLSQEDDIRRALIQSLNRQSNPAVQIALIHALIELRDKEAIPALQEVIDSQEIFDKVKEEARLGLFKIS
ncbi:MAG: HEAT repeat domain-containing protein, partial [Bacteroidota bacterium]